MYTSGGMLETRSNILRRADCIGSGEKTGVSSSDHVQPSFHASLLAHLHRGWCYVHEALAPLYLTVVAMLHILVEFLRRRVARYSAGWWKIQPEAEG